MILGDDYVYDYGEWYYNYNVDDNHNTKTTAG